MRAEPVEARLVCALRQAQGTLRQAQGTCQYQPFADLKLHAAQGLP
jgi:hypothetical protein